MLVVVCGLMSWRGVEDDVGGCGCGESSLVVFLFFFSKRRRDLRLTCVEGSDVCSSDLFCVFFFAFSCLSAFFFLLFFFFFFFFFFPAEIGRAVRGERGYILGVAVSLKKKKSKKYTSLYISNFRSLI